MNWTVCAAALLLMGGAWAPMVRAEDHVVPLSTLRQDLGRAAAQRPENAAEIERVLATPLAQQELAKARLSSTQVQKAISLMSDEELARLATQARAAGQDVQGGFIKTILAIIGAIVVILIVVALVA